MKKTLALVLALILALGALASCGGSSALGDAVSYLNSLYKDEAASTPTDYDVVGKILIGEEAFTVTWTADSDIVAIKESATAGFYTVDVPAKNDAEAAYVLTATITDASGKSETVTFSRSVPVVDTTAIVSAPEEGAAYKFQLIHAGLGKTLYATHDLQDNKFIKTTDAAKDAPDFFAEKDGDGYKFYTTISGKKMYVTASLAPKDGGGFSKVLNYSEAGSTWTYKAETNAWFTTIDGGEYVVGTYGSYNTFCISEASYITAENTGKTQFPGGLIAKATAESAVVENNVVIYSTPKEIVDAAYALADGGILSGGESYTLTGVISAVDTPYSEQYGNVTVTIVVDNMTDKPIMCYRLKGDNAATIKVGDTITVTGSLKNYKGTIEFDAGCTLG